MGPKVISLRSRANQDKDEYLKELRELNAQLRGLADKYGESSRAVISDLTYLVVSDDILDFLENRRSGENGKFN